MIRVLRKVLILFAIFAVSLFIFSRVTNHEVRNMTENMSQASLPVISIQSQGHQINEMHGYTSSMNMSLMRESICPLQSGGNISLQIKTYGSKVDRLAYQVRSLDGKKLIEENGNVSLTDTSDTEISAQIKLENGLKNGNEYMLILQLDMNGKKVNYYSRIYAGNTTSTQQCIDFALNFHNSSMDEKNLSQLSNYLEPSSDADNSTLQTVTIENRLSQIGWGTLNVQEETEPVVSVCEINDSYEVIVITGVVSSENKDGSKDYYNVKEYYRIRPGSQRMFLLNFKRTVNEIFQKQKADSQALNLGIRDTDVDYWSTETGKTVCFVQEGDLWSYNRDNGQLTKVFSFREDDSFDSRENYNQHDIRIMSADDVGSVNFLVYGYMNRGEHEGRCGISLMHYDGITNTVEELLFIPCKSPYQILKEEIGSLAYINSQGTFFISLGNELHAIDIETGKDKVLLKNFREGTYYVSENGRYTAWVENSASASTVLNITDLDTEKTMQIKADEGCYIRPLGFLQSDCIYGLAKQSDIGAGQSFPMYTIRIADVSEDLQTVEKYEKSGVYIKNVTISEGTIYMNLLKQSGKGWENAGQDTITNRDVQESRRVRLNTKTDSEKQTQMQLIWTDTADTVRTSLRNTKMIVIDHPITAKIDPSLFTSSYYIYAEGEVIGVSGNVSSAVALADKNMGTVVDNKMNYIWERAKQSSHSASQIDQPTGNSSTAKALNCILKDSGSSADADQLLNKGTSPLNILQSQMKNCSVLNVSGCTVDQILYYVGKGSLVYVQTGKDSAVLITGYNSEQVWIYDPADNKTRQMTISKAQEEFAADGSVFYTYLKK